MIRKVPKGEKDDSDEKSKEQDKPKEALPADQTTQQIPVFPELVGKYLVKRELGRGKF